ncbi:MAG: CBS domain-containing protein [Gemmatimonadota bacterium]
MVKLHDIMSVEVTSLDPNMTLREATEVLSSEHFGGAPVVAGDRVVGVISIADLLDFVSSNPGPPTLKEERAEWGESSEKEEAWNSRGEPAAAYFGEMWSDVFVQVDERFRKTDSPEWDILEEHVVSEIMTHRLCQLPPETDVRDAAEFMLRAGIHRVLVTEEGRLVGVASTTDIVKAVAQHGLGG